MFDKINFRAKIDINDIEAIVLRNYLEQCVEGDEVYYKSTAYANFDGVDVMIRGDTLRCKCSINKLYYKLSSGKLDNSKPITFDIAVRTIYELLLRLYVKPENAVATYYEIGLTMKMPRPANEYIKLMEEASGRTMWNDANFPKYRQKTTEKSKNFRKYFKAYDKTHEAKEKRRAVQGNILRIEKVYKHQNIQLVELLSELFLNKLAATFYKDWSGLVFVRQLNATKGVKMSQLEKARELYRLGIRAYKEKYRSMFLAGEVTKKQWETIRNFANSWSAEKVRYIEVVSPQEAEFKDRLLSAYQTGKTTLFKRKI